MAGVAALPQSKVPHTKLKMCLSKMSAGAVKGFAAHTTASLDALEMVGEEIGKKSDLLAAQRDDVEPAQLGSFLGGVASMMTSAMGGMPTGSWDTATLSSGLGKISGSIGKGLGLRATQQGSSAVMDAAKIGDCMALIGDGISKKLGDIVAGRSDFNGDSAFEDLAELAAEGAMEAFADMPASWDESDFGSAATKLTSGFVGGMGGIHDQLSSGGNAANKLRDVMNKISEGAGTALAAIAQARLQVVSCLPCPSPIWLCCLVFSLTHSVSEE